MIWKWIYILFLTCQSVYVVLTLNTGVECLNTHNPLPALPLSIDKAWWISLHWSSSLHCWLRHSAWMQLWWRSRPALRRDPPQPRCPSTTSTAATTTHFTVTSQQPARPSASVWTWPWCASSTSSAPWSMTSKPRRPTSNWAATLPARPRRRPHSRPGHTAILGPRTSAAAPGAASMERDAVERKPWRAREGWVEEEEEQVAEEQVLLGVYHLMGPRQAWTHWGEGSLEDAAPSDARSDVPLR